MKIEYFFISSPRPSLPFSPPPPPFFYQFLPRHTAVSLPSDIRSPSYLKSACSGTMLRSFPSRIAIRALEIAHSSILVSVSTVEVPI